MILVTVTAEDIAEGIRGDCSRCAVARAMTRATGSDGCEVIERAWCILHLKIGSYWIAAPKAVVQLVCLLDSGHEGFSLRFALPDVGSPEWLIECDRCDELCEPISQEDGFLCRRCRKGKR